MKIILLFILIMLSEIELSASMTKRNENIPSNAKFMLHKISLIYNFIPNRSLLIEFDDTIKTASIIDVDTLNLFCPNENMIQQLVYLENCCCLSEVECQSNTSNAGIKVIQEGFQMAIVNKEIIKGSCWDFINAVYLNAGYPQSKRENIYKNKKGSKYTSLDFLQPGDWIYHVNYSFYNVGHSAIFVCWKDYDKHIAITLSYIGQNKLQPGRYSEYDLSGIYNVIRAKD